MADLSSLPVFDIVETLGEDGRVVASSITPTSAIDSKFQAFLESAVQSGEKEPQIKGKNPPADITEIEDKDGKAPARKEAQETKVPKSLNVNRIRRKKVRQQKLQEINQRYFRDEETSSSGKKNSASDDAKALFRESATTEQSPKEKKSVKFNDSNIAEFRSADQLDMVQAFKDLEIADDRIFEQDFSKMSFEEFSKSFHLPKASTNSTAPAESTGRGAPSLKKDFVSDIIVPKNGASNESGQGLYDILEQKKKAALVPKHYIRNQLKKSTAPDRDAEAEDSRVKTIKKVANNETALGGNLKSLAKKKPMRSKKKAKKSSGAKGTATAIGVPDLKPYYLQDIETKTKDEEPSSNEASGTVTIVKNLTHALSNADKSLQSEAEEGNLQVAEHEPAIKSAAGNQIESKAEGEEEPAKLAEFPTTKVDYRALNQSIDDMVTAYMMGIYDDDVEIEYDMPNSIIEDTKDIEKYNQQVLLVEKELEKERQNGDVASTAKSDSAVNAASSEKVGLTDQEAIEAQPLLADQIVERDEAVKSFEEQLNEYHIVNDSDVEDDYTFKPEVMNQEIARNYQYLRQHLISVDSGFNKGREAEIEPIDEFGNPVRLSKFKAAQINPNLPLM